MFKTTKAKIIFVTIFSISCILVTILLIWYQNIEIEEKKEDISQNEITSEKDIPGIDLKSTYNQNDLIINELSVTHEKAEIQYFQISGLKNKTIENSINNEIQQEALNFYKKDIENLDEVINVSVNMSEYANFANVLSLEISYYAKIDDNDDGFYLGNKCLNYDLNTGEKISIDKVFTSDAPIEDILRKSAYNNLISCTLEDSLSGDLIVSDYGDIEDEIANIIYLYKNGKIRNFVFTPLYINLYYKENETITIKMEDYFNYIAIYNRYLTQESLFEKDNIGIKNIYALTTRNNNWYYYTNYQNESNYFIDISIDSFFGEDDEFEKNIVQNKINVIEKEIEKVKQEVVKNPESFYVLNYHINIYNVDEESMNKTLVKCREIGNSYEMTVNDFEENVEPIIIKHIKSNNDFNGERPDYIYNLVDLLDIEPQETVEYYDSETGEKIVI